MTLSLKGILQMRSRVW